MNRIYGLRTAAGLKVWVDDSPVPLAPSLKAWRHSPTGFECGYAGSGPAQLALAILMMFTDKDNASRLHQNFKFGFLADGKYFGVEEFEINVDITAWIKEQVQS